MKKINFMELLGFTIWVLMTLITTILITQYLMPESFSPNSLAHQIFQYRDFFKRIFTVLLSLVLLIPFAGIFVMFLQQTDPADFTNFQGSRR